MPRTPDVPDLDTFIRTRRSGTCAFCQQVPEELAAAITDRVNQGIRAWKAYAEWLNACGFPLNQHRITYHFDALKVDPDHGKDA